MKYSY